MAVELAVDPTADVAEYLARIEQLYADVQAWVSAFEPQDRFSRTEIELLEQHTGPVERPLYPGVPDGWAWADEARNRLVHLEPVVFRNAVLETMS